MSKLHWMLQKILLNNNQQPLIIMEYEKWLASAKHKDKFIYYKGLSPMQSYVGQIIKARTYTDYENGLVHLVTKKYGENNYDFIAIRSSKKI